jgi:metal-responsive CopG/Arc/MetJ family transcriptional regulator
MKVKTSVTLSEKLLAAIDEVAGPGCNRSAVLEEAAADWVRRRRREEDNRHDAAVYATLTAEQIADSDVLKDSIDPLELGDAVELETDVTVDPGAKGSASAAR